MEFTEVRVKLVANKDDRLKGFCSMTLDNDFVVRDIKVIEGTNGLFVAMPSIVAILLLIALKSFTIFETLIMLCVAIIPP